MPHFLVVLHTITDVIVYTGLGFFIGRDLSRWQRARRILRAQRQQEKLWEEYKFNMKL